MIGTAASGSRLRNPDKFYIGGEWVEPSSDATIEVIDSNDEQPFLRVAEATAADMERAVGAARDAFDRGEWRRLGHLERAGYLRAMGAALRARSDTLADILPRESGMLFAHSQKSLVPLGTPWWRENFTGLRAGGRPGLLALCGRAGGRVPVLRPRGRARVEDAVVRPPADAVCSLAGPTPSKSLAPGAVLRAVNWRFRARGLDFRLPPAPAGGRDR